MPPSYEPEKKEHASTYFVQDRSNIDEFARLRIQDQAVTAGMGGVLPEQLDLSDFLRVLDVGCGTGGWLIEVAKAYPTLSLLVGVDISGKMLDHAREQAVAQGVSDQVEFLVMDALRLLEFPTGYFDLTNQRLGLSYLRTWDWPKLLHEYQRVTRPGGVIRVTESDTLIEPGSPARTRLYDLTLDAFYQAGHFFVREKNGVTSHLARLLHEHAGVRDVQTRAYRLEYHTGTAEGQHFYEDIKLAYRNVVPFFRKWTRVPDDYDTIYQAVLTEMHQPDFVAGWDILTAWGITAGQHS